LLPTRKESRSFCFGSGPSSHSKTSTPQLSNHTLVQFYALFGFSSLRLRRWILGFWHFLVSSFYPLFVFLLHITAHFHFKVT
jgi:hypothetical protein